MLRLRLLALFCAAAVPFLGCSASTSDDDGGDDTETEPTGATNDELRSAVSCKERTETGYRHGAAFPIAVITVGGKPVAKPAGHAFLKMQAAADAAGVRLAIASGFRTMAEQQRLYSCYVHQSCNDGNLAAKPGYSNHQSGSALDLSTSSWLAKNAHRFGFVRTVSREAWHYEYTDTKDPGGPCTRTTTHAAADDDEPSGDGLPWVAPTDDSEVENGFTLKVHAKDPRIAEVRYRAGNYPLAASHDAAHDFPLHYTFTVLGDRTLTAEGYDAQGNKIASSTIDVTIH